MFEIYRWLSVEKRWLLIKVITRDDCKWDSPPTCQPEGCANLYASRLRIKYPQFRYKLVRVE